MRLKKILALLAATLFAATAVACASMPADGESRSPSSSQNEREVPNGYY